MVPMRLEIKLIYELFWQVFFASNFTTFGTEWAFWTTKTLSTLCTLGDYFNSIHVDLTSVDSIHKNPASLKKWTLFCGDQPKRQIYSPLEATRRYSTILDDTRWYSTILDDTRRYSTILDDTRRYSTILDDTRRYLMILMILMILNDTRQKPCEFKKMNTILWRSTKTANTVTFKPGPIFGSD
jgi:hypothetical protein